MVFIALLGLGILFASLVSAGQSQTTVVMCSSFSCAYNKKARCTRKEVVVYDNAVIGLCLYHTETMKKRVLVPMNKVTVVEKGEPNLQMISKIMKVRGEQHDKELLDNPEIFGDWMKKQGIGGL